MRPGKMIKRLIPNKAVAVRILGRQLYLKRRADMAIYRLSVSARLAPCSEELSSIVSLMGFMRPGMTFVDVGANVGLYSMPFASVGSVAGFNVVAIEPDPDTAARLRRALADYPESRVVECACSDREGDRTLIRTDSSMTSKLATRSLADDAGRWKAKGGIPVRCRRLDEILKNDPSPYVIKMDVEGHEREVLTGASALFESDRVAALLVDAASLVDIKDLLNKGFVCFNARTLKRQNDAYASLFLSKRYYPIKEGS